MSVAWPRQVRIFGGESLSDRHLLIDGSFVDGEGPSRDVIEPSTGDVHVSWPDSSPAQVSAAVEAAARAFPGWRDCTQDERSAALRSIADDIESLRGELAVALTHETGRALSRNGLYVDMAAAVFRQYAELARVDSGRVTPANDPGQLSFVQKVPYGVVAALVPFNYPLLLLTFKVAPALAVETRSSSSRPPRHPCRSRSWRRSSPVTSLLEW